MDVFGRFGESVERVFDFINKRKLDSAYNMRRSKNEKDSGKIIGIKYIR